MSGPIKRLGRQKLPFVVGQGLVLLTFGLRNAGNVKQDGNQLVAGVGRQRF
jgi:hypothetical protein